MAGLSELPIVEPMASKHSSLRPRSFVLRAKVVAPTQ
jgi:hypothetical protein